MEKAVLNHMIKVATDAMKNSNVKSGIGAAVLGSSGKVYGGTFFVSIPLDYCAERVALLKALSEGEKKIDAVVIAWHGKGSAGGPCGICLNALWQLSNNPNLKVISHSIDSKRTVMRKIRDVYPYPYDQKI